MYVTTSHSCSLIFKVFTPHMQSPENNNSSASKSNEKQGAFSISLWKNAFGDALQRLCPMRGGGHECGCLPVLARMVMEKCVGRFDIAMFNAILRESEHQIPTDPVSDPILDTKVLPVPAGDLSFGSGAQLKNAVIKKNQSSVSFITIRELTNPMSLYSPVADR